MSFSKAFAALFFLHALLHVVDAHVVQHNRSPTDSLSYKSTRLPEFCSAPTSVATGLCVCYLNYSNSPQFSFYTFGELASGKTTCLAQFQDVGFILGSYSSCDRYRQGSPNVNIWWLLGEANNLIANCAPGVPQLRYPN